MAKKVFYAKRLRLAKWQQPYFTWLILFLFLLPLLFWAGTKKHTPKNQRAAKITKTEKFRSLDFINKFPDKNPSEADKISLIQNFQKYKMKNFKGEKLTLENCHHLFLLPENKNTSRNIWLFVPYTEKKALLLLPNLLEHLELNTATPLFFLVLYDSSPSCSVSHLARQLSERKLWVPHGVLFYAQVSPFFNPVIYNHLALPLMSGDFLLEIPISPLLAQVSLGALGNLITAYPKLRFFDRFFLRLPIESLSIENLPRQLGSYTKNEYERNSFWISSKRQLYPWSAIILTILLLLMCFIPILNRITIQRAKPSLLKPFLTAIYYSMVMWILFIYIYFFPGKKNAILLFFSCLFVIIITFYVLLYIKQRFLNLASDSTSALLLFWGWLAFQAFFHQTWIFLLTPAALFLGFVKEKPLSFTFLLIPLAFFLPALAIYQIILEIPISYWQWDSLELTNISFLGGTLLSLIDRQVPEQ